MFQGWIRPLSLITLPHGEEFKRSLQQAWVTTGFKPAVIPTSQDVDSQAPKAGRSSIILFCLVHRRIIARLHIVTDKVVTLTNF